MSKQQLNIQYDNLKNNVEEQIRALQSQIPPQLLPKNFSSKKSYLKTASNVYYHRPHVPSINDYLQAQNSNVQKQQNQNTNDILLQVIQSQKQLTKVLKSYADKIDHHYRSKNSILQQMVNKPTKQTNQSKLTRRSKSKKIPKSYSNKMISVYDYPKKRESYINPYQKRYNFNEFDQYYTRRQRSSNKSRKMKHKSKINNSKSNSVTKLSTIYTQLSKSKDKMPKNQIKKVVHKVFQDYGYRY